jgi:hypothetical protein
MQKNMWCPYFEVGMHKLAATRMNYVQTHEATSVFGLATVPVSHLQPAPVEITDPQTHRVMAVIGFRCSAELAVDKVSGIPSGYATWPEQTTVRVGIAVANSMIGVDGGSARQ